MKNSQPSINKAMLLNSILKSLLDSSFSLQFNFRSLTPLEPRTLPLGHDLRTMVVVASSGSLRWNRFSLKLINPVDRNE